MRQSSKAQHAVHEHADLQLTYGVAVLMSWHACAFCNFHVQCIVPLLSRAKHKMFWRVCMSCIYACTAGDGTPTTGHTAELLGQGRHSWASERKQLNKGLAQISKSNLTAGQFALQSHADIVMCSKFGHCLQSICHHQMLGVCV